jgi:hypothetical protein
MDSTCVVFVCDYGYFHKFLKTLQGLVKEGEYTGDICLIIGDDLKDSPLLENPLMKEAKVIVQHFPDIEIPFETREIMAELNRDIKWYLKVFQYHKFHVFQTFVKRWRRILYLDSGITIYRPIQPLLGCWKDGKFLAHCDSFPLFDRQLRQQFDTLNPFIEQLETIYDMSCLFPQTTIMYFDSNLITETTFQELYDLMLRFPNSLTNDQGILALYFTQIRKCWEQIQTGDLQQNYYDFWSRNNGKPYIMLKVVV